MRILIATGLYPPEIGGPATYVKMLETYLPERGIDLRIEPFQKVRRYPKLIRHMVYAFRLLRASHQTDIIFALDAVSVGWPALVVSRLRNKPLWLRIPGDYAWEQAQLRFGVTDPLHKFDQNRSSYSWPVRILNWLQGVVARRAQVVIVPSQYMNNLVQGWGVSPDRLRTIYSAIEQPNVTEEKKVLQTRLGLSNPLLVSAGRLVPNKGFVALIKAVAELRAKGEEVTLVIVGSGPQQSELVQLCKELGVENGVRLLGSMPQVELWNLMAAADLFVLNTAHEGLSHVILEAMSLGVPVITTPVGGNPELVAHKKTGWLVPYNQVSELVKSISQLLADPTMQQHLQTAAQQKAKEFTHQATINKLLQLIRSL